MPANRHRSLALVALIPREPQAHERLGDPALNALLTHLTARLVVDVALTDGGRSGGDALALSMEQVLPEGQVATAGGGGEAGFDLLEGDDQQIALAELVPQHAQALDPGGVGKSWRDRWRRG